MKKLLLIAAVCFVLSITAEKAIATATIDCDHGTFDSGHADHPRKNTVPRGYYMVWKVQASMGTQVTIEFVDKNDNGDHGKGESPFFDKKSSFDQTIFNPGDKIYRGPVAADTAIDKYGYKITCKTLDGTSKEIDPIIDVPH
jgi:hypothetical protein